MEEKIAPEEIVGRYLFLIRVVTFVFVLSSAIFCAIVVNFVSLPGIGPFGIEAEALSPLVVFLPLFGVLFIAVGVLLHRKVPDTKWFWSRSPMQRLQMYLLIVLLRLTFLEMATLPGVFYFLLGHSTEWLLLLGIVSIFLMLLGIPAKERLEAIFQKGTPAV